MSGQATTDTEEHHLLPAATAQGSDLIYSLLASIVDATHKILQDGHARGTERILESPFHAAQAGCMIKLRL